MMTKPDFHRLRQAAGRERDRLREAAIEYYRYLVPHTRRKAVRALPRRVEEGDLLGAGYRALVQVVDRFDPERGVKFESLAITWIRGAMREELRRQDWAPRGLPAERRDELAPVSLEVLVRGVDEFGPPDRLGDLIPDPADPPEALCMAEALRTAEWEQIVRALSWLPEREKAVVVRWYEGDTLREIGAAFGVSESRVHQLYSAGMARLRLFLGLRDLPPDKPRRKRRPVCQPPQRYCRVCRGPYYSRGLCERHWQDAWEGQPASQVASAPPAGGGRERLGALLTAWQLDLRRPLPQDVRERLARESGLTLGGVAKTLFTLRQAAGITVGRGGGRSR